jgi:hypothetical protein
MNRTEALTEVLRDPARSEKERGIAARALQAANVSADVAVVAAPDPQVMTDDTRMMLAALRVGRIADLDEDIYERYCIAHCVKPSDPIVKEFRFWIPPPATFLSTIGMTLREWWEAILDLAVAANRPDAQAHARRQLASLQ